jgi:hypothetical protein
LNSQAVTQVDTIWDRLLTDGETVLKDAFQKVTVYTGSFGPYTIRSDGASSEMPHKDLNKITVLNKNISSTRESTALLESTGFNQESPVVYTMHIVSLRFMSSADEGPETQSAEGFSAPQQGSLPFFEELQVINSLSVYYEMAQQLPLQALFGVESDQEFPCVLPGHQGHAMARVSYWNGRYQYRCSSCHQGKRSLDIHDLIETMTGLDHGKVRRLLMKVMNLAFNHPEMKQAEQNIIEFQRRIVSSDFQEKYPLLHQEMVSNDLYGSLLLLLAIHLRYSVRLPDGQIVCIVSFARLVELAKQFFPQIKDRKELHRKVSRLKTLGLLATLPDEALPSRMLSDMKKSQVRHGRQYRVSAYAVPAVTASLFQSAEDSLVRHASPVVMDLFAAMQFLGGFVTEEAAVKKLRGYKKEVRQQMLKDSVDSLAKTGWRRQILTKSLAAQHNIPYRPLTPCYVYESEVA